jgi:N-methylhydantoinase B
MQNAFAVVRNGLPGADVDRTIEEFGGTVEWLPPKKVTSLTAGDAFANYGAGGGGFGDPLARTFERVRHDVLEGLVSVDGALRDYGVVVDADGEVDVDASTAARAARRPSIVATAVEGARRLSSTLVVLDGRVRCRCCGHDLGPASVNVKDHLVLDERSAGYRWPVIDTMSGAARFVVRRFSCPGCAVQVDVEVNLNGSPFVWSASWSEPRGGSVMTITKLVFCVRKRPELSDEEFQTYWLERHGPLVRSFFESGRFPGMVRYVQSHTVFGEPSDRLQASRGSGPAYEV